MKNETIIYQNWGDAVGVYLPKVKEDENGISIKFDFPKPKKLKELEKVADNLKRYWRALKRELGDNETLRLDFADTINFELKQNGLINEVKKDEFAILIFNS